MPRPRSTSADLLAIALICTVAGVLLLAGAALGLGEPLPPIRQPVNVTSVASLPTVTATAEVVMFVPVPASPVTWSWFAVQRGGCAPELRLSPVCDRPTPSPYYPERLGR